MSTLPLSADWLAWVRENLDRGCSDASMVAAMTRDGAFSADVARRCIQQCRAERGSGSIEAGHGSRPGPDLGMNTIDCGDRIVKVTLAMDRPCIVLFADVLSAGECEALVALADARMSRSTVIDDVGGHPREDANRISTGASFQRGESPLLAALEARIARLLNWPVEHGEGVQVLRYEGGGEYRPHSDYFDPAKPGSTHHLEAGGQRVGTLIMYLSDVAAGGATRFPAMGLEARPSKGSALYFANVDADGRIDVATMHAGLPVTGGVKYIATKWLRERAY